MSRAAAFQARLDEALGADMAKLDTIALAETAGVLAIGERIAQRHVGRLGERLEAAVNEFVRRQSESAHAAQ